MVEISVVIPVFNREHLVREAIESSIEQEVDAEFEIVVSDDGSTDRTADVAESYGGRVRVIRAATNRGGAAARNAGILAARGELIALLDSDDRMLPGRLQVQADYLRRHAEVGLVSSSVEHERGDSSEDYFRLRGLEIPPGEWLLLDRPLPRVTRGFFANSSATMARRSLLIDAGLYDEGLFNPDLEILFRIARRTKFACYNRPLGWVRAPHVGRPTPPSDAGLRRAHQAWIKILRETPELEAEDRRIIGAKISSASITYLSQIYLRSGGTALRRAIARCAGDVDPGILSKWLMISRIPLPLGKALVALKSRRGGNLSWN